jgi:hypothetical protein
MWAFSDESERGDRMLLGLVVIETAAVEDARRALRGLLLPGQRRVHTAKESPRRRAELLGVIARLEVEAVVFSVRRPSGVRRIASREILIRVACAEILGRGVAAWVLDHQDGAQAARDRRTIELAVAQAGAPLVYDHRRSHTEPLLWAADAVVWAIGAGGEWRRRITAVTDVRTILP